MTTQLTTITNLNNEAVQCMQRGRFDLAVTKLSEGVRHLHADMDPQANEPLRQEDHRGGDPNWVGPIYSAPLPQHQCSSSLCANAPQTDDCIFIYQNAYVLTLLAPACSPSLSSLDLKTVNAASSSSPSSGSSSSSLSWSDQVRVSSVLLYNIALAYHLQGLARRGNKEATMLLEKALRIYNMIPVFSLRGEALAQVIRQGNDDNANSDASLVRLHLALWNNMGNIHHCLLQRQDAARCCQELQALLCATDNNSNCPSSQLLLPPEEYLFFLLNTLLLDASRAEPAPAA